MVVHAKLLMYIINDILLLKRYTHTHTFTHTTTHVHTRTHTHAHTHTYTHTQTHTHTHICTHNVSLLRLLTYSLTVSFRAPCSVLRAPCSHSIAKTLWLNGHYTSHFVSLRKRPNLKAQCHALGMGL